MTINEITSYSNAEQLINEYGSDGVIIDLIYFNEEEKENVCNWLKSINDNRILVVVPNKESSSDISKDLSRYKSILYLKTDLEFLKEDKAIESQLDLLYEDIVNKITNYLNKNYELTRNNCSIYTNSKQYKFIKPIELSNLLSEICKNNFYNTPKINNELINKSNISSPIQKARDTIVHMLLCGSYKKFDYTKNSPECTLFRATIKNQFLLDNNKTNHVIVNEIYNFIKDAEKEEICFDKLYQILISNEKGIGARKGILPIYLAFVLKDYKEESILYLKSGRSKKEMNLEYSILTNINNHPEKYLLKIEKGTVEKTKYTNELSDIYLPYLNLNSDNKFINIVKGMQAWLQSLSILTQNYKEDVTDGTVLSSDIRRLRKDIMRYEMNYREFLFHEMKSILGTDSYEECIYKLKEIKKKLDSYDNKVKEYVINKTSEVINASYKGSLSSNLRAWYIDIEEDKKTHLYNGTTNEFLKLLEKIGNNDEENINRLARVMTGLSIEDWNDTTIDVYFETLNNCKKLIDNYEIAESNASGSLIRILIDDEDDKEIEKTFNRAEVSSIGSVLLNAIDETIEEFGDSIDDNEKRNILMRILERYI
ncbi:hypothetical protein [Clostridium chromiireducens]|uniref:Uncharacterized protein n=1 Tax=Clostridium chromiireducens TaxID=225345 RepID=A0A1V4I886_9CLOT|nr:hypothetical protein [Clostridium chromiireducens]OPJ56119.1 hypothetical protein CLCHR_45990 [Clostridium chromiireducens]